MALPDVPPPRSSGRKCSDARLTETFRRETPQFECRPLGLRVLVQSPRQLALSLNTKQPSPTELARATSGETGEPEICGNYVKIS
ncbi:hypothetical protein KOW79_005667 [Hemibagrus wyckioides]|uniref:Uncharacterized protein n=1 Tax=Hemibagrus wyckioides TaxID=337641 RepID=A0A9D3SUD8_9TELE|nr:hypothetical protein KOW79_005667 [Hemibagrus wyckioides]